MSVCRGNDGGPSQVGGDLFAAEARGHFRLRKDGGLRDPSDCMRLAEHCVVAQLLQAS